jgi:ABC-type amino acid transport substrate-binding protein
MLAFRFLRLATRAAAIALPLLSVPADAVEIRTAAQTASDPKFVALHERGASAVGGLCIDILRAMEKADPELKFTGDQAWQPLVRMEAGMASGDLDVICGLLRTKVRESRYIYIEPPLFPVTYHLVVRVDDEVHVNNWDEVRALGDKGVVLVNNGFGIIDRLENTTGIRIDAGAYTTKANLSKLLAGRGRFFYHRSPGIMAEIRAAGMEGRVKVLPAAMHSEKFYLAASSKLPQETVERLRKAVAELDRNGELARLLKKWSL